MTAYFLAPSGETSSFPGSDGVAAAPGNTQAPGGSQGGGGSSLIMFLAFVPLIVMMLWQSRSQQKKRKQLEEKLKTGDRVITQSGLVGKLVEWGDARYAKLEIAPGVKVQMLRSAVMDRDEEPAPEKK